MGPDSSTFRDKGTEYSSLSRDKGTMGQAQNLATGRNRPGQPIKIWDGTQDGTITIFQSNSGREQGRDNRYFFPMIFFSSFKTSFFCFRTSFSCFRMPFSCFFGESDLVPGRPGSEKFVPGCLLLPFTGTKGRPVPYCHGTSLPVLSWDIPSL